MASSPYADLRRALSAQRAELLARWRDRYRASPWRIGRAEEAELVSLVVPILDHLADALGDEASEPSVLQPGSDRLCELERSVAFAGGAMAATAASGFDLAAALRALRDTLAEHAGGEGRAALTDLFDWLTVMALHSLATASADRQRELIAEQLDDGLQVRLLTPELPALVLVGDLGHDTLDTVYGRLVLAIVRVGAPAVIVDVSGLPDAAAPHVIDSTLRFFEHPQVSGVDVLAVGFRNDTAEGAWKRAASATGARMRSFLRFDDAVAAGLQCGGYQLIRPRS